MNELESLVRDFGPFRHLYGHNLPDLANAWPLRLAVDSAVYCQVLLDEIPSPTPRRWAVSELDAVRVTLIVVGATNGSGTPDLALSPNDGPRGRSLRLERVPEGLKLSIVGDRWRAEVLGHECLIHSFEPVSRERALLTASAGPLTDWAY